MSLFFRAQDDWGVDFVGQVLVLVRVGNRGIEPLEQGVERLVLAAHKHGQTLRVVAAGGDAFANGTESEAESFSVYRRK